MNELYAIYDNAGEARVRVYTRDAWDTYYLREAAKTLPRLPGVQSHAFVWGDTDCLPMDYWRELVAAVQAKSEDGFWRWYVRLSGRLAKALDDAEEMLGKGITAETVNPSGRGA